MIQSLKDYMTTRRKREATWKGNAFEEEVGEAFRQAGATVEVTKLNRRFVRNRKYTGWITERADYFGAADWMAFWPGRAPFIFGQATTDRGKLRLKQRQMDKLGPYAPGRLLVVATRPVSNEGIEFHALVAHGWMYLGEGVAGIVMMQQMT